MYNYRVRAKLLVRNKCEKHEDMYEGNILITFIWNNGTDTIRWGDTQENKKPEGLKPISNNN